MMIEHRDDLPPELCPGVDKARTIYIPELGPPLMHWGKKQEEPERPAGMPRAWRYYHGDEATNTIVIAEPGEEVDEWTVENERAHGHHWRELKTSPLLLRGVLALVHISDELPVRDPLPYR